MSIDPEIAIKKFSRLRRRAATALESTRGLNARVRDLTEELRGLQAEGVPQPPPGAVAAAAALAEGIKLEVDKAQHRRSRVPTPPETAELERSLSKDPVTWVQRWNADQRRIRQITTELEDLEQARDEASREWNQTGALLGACRDFLASHNIQVGA